MIAWPCKCGHPKADHSGSSGPNSIGQWFFGQCVNGSTSVAIYRFGGCQCHSFRRLFPVGVRKTRASESETGSDRA